MNKPHINIGNLGHVDHGKTTLTTAISKVLYNKFWFWKDTSFSDIDSLPEEKKRWITIRSAHVWFETDNRSYNSLDIPWHADFVKNAILWLNQMDYWILVIAWTDGIMEQTREHIILWKQIWVKKLVVYINKCDVVNDDELLELIELEVLELLEKNWYKDDDYKIIRGSALLSLNEPTNYENKYGAKTILEIFEYLESLPIPSRESEKPFLMSVEDCFSIKGRWTVITGTPVKWKIKVWDKIEIYNKKKDKPLQTTVTGVQQFHKDIDEWIAGTNLGILIRWIEKEDIWRWATVILPKTYQRKIKAKAKIYLLTAKEGWRHNPIFNNYSPLAFIRNEDTRVSIKLDKEDWMIMPWDYFECDLTFWYPVFIEKNDSFSIREWNLTIGSWKII